jgi:hypothetical protein
LGKQANCQVAVSVHAVSDTASCPLQWRLFVPQEWADDPARRRKTRVPEEIGHREKWRLALDVLDELASWGLVPPMVVVADARYLHHLPPPPARNIHHQPKPESQSNLTESYELEASMSPLITIPSVTHHAHARNRGSGALQGRFRDRNTLRMMRSSRGRPEGVAPDWGRRDGAPAIGLGEHGGQALCLAAEGFW